MRSEAHRRSCLFAPPRRDQVSDGGVAVGLKALHGVLEDAIGIGYALMLPQVLEPGIDPECLDKDTLF